VHHANALHSQLEIIGPSGQIEFHDLDPGKGVTNIGRTLKMTS